MFPDRKQIIVGTKTCQSEIRTAGRTSDEPPHTCTFSRPSQLPVCGSLLGYSLVSSCEEDLLAFPLSLFVTLVIKAVCSPATE